MKKVILLSSILAWVLSSCYSSNVRSNGIIQKRKYNKGFFISKSDNKNSSKNEPAESIDNGNLTYSNVQETIEYSDETFYQTDIAILSNDIIMNDVNTTSSVIETQTTNSSKSRTVSSNLQENCDMMIFKNGDEKEVKILEIGKTDIRYRKCNEPDGTIFTVSNSQVLMIKHPDGSKTVLSELQNTGSSAENPFDSSEGKNQLVAAILAFFLGVLGIHRFYLGHIGMGILYLLTAGLCGIGALVDFILILTGSLKPKNGEYGKTI